MKVTVLQSDLNKWLGVVSRVVPNRGQLPVLANILLEAGKDGLKLAATNLEVGLRVEVGGKINQVGSITVPAKNFAEFVASLPLGNVELETEGEKLNVTAGKMAGVFAGISASEFPAMPKIEDVGASAKSFTVKRATILKIGTTVAMAAASDESRPVLTGVLINFEDNAEMWVTATDGFRLSRQKIKGVEMKGLEKGIIIPARTILEMARVVGEGKKEEVTLGVVAESNQVVMEYDGTELMSRVLEGNFPEVNKIIPADFRTEIEIEREDLVRAIKAAGIFARDAANVVRFKIEDGKLIISASSTNTGESNMELEIEKKGDDGQIAFNYRYVLDFLNSVSGDKIVFKMNESLTPGVFGVSDEPGLIYLIMPVRI